MRKIITLFAIAALGAQAKEWTVASPDEALKVTVSDSPTLTYSADYYGQPILEASQIGINQVAPKVTRATRQSVRRIEESPLYRSATVQNHYNQLTLKLKGDWALEFRVYDNGMAYRWVYGGKKPVEITGETVEYRFPGNPEASVPYVRDMGGAPYEAQFFNSFENVYTTKPISELDSKRLAFLPLMVNVEQAIKPATTVAKVAITDVNINGYPGLYLVSCGEPGVLKGVMAPIPAEVKQGGHNNLQMVPQSYSDVIAKLDGPRALPWRAMVVGQNDAAVAQSDLTYLLADPSKIADTSWIKPGKVAWEWWNDWNIIGVDFPTGVNNATYKAYIDFAAKHGIEYVILDEGWAVNRQADLFAVVPEIDLEALVEYGKQKGVGIILWAGYYAFARDMERVCKHYADMGVKGFKVDFLDRDDADMTAFEYAAAECAARHGLVLDMHGTHKPAGITRTWPNVLNYEGVHGLEQMKWISADYDACTYDTQIPFTRQVAGPMDYTQGAMLNAARGQYRPSNSQPMSQGTRCHQLGLYMVLDSPLTMLCDSPSNYEREPECTEFIASVPTVWDETRVLDGRFGEYVVTARRSGDTWYIGGISNSTPRDIEIDLSPLGVEGKSLTLFSDGVNARRNGQDYKKQTLSAPNTLKLHLAPGGGFAAILSSANF